MAKIIVRNKRNGITIEVPGGLVFASDPDGDFVAQLGSALGTVSLKDSRTGRFLAKDMAFASFYLNSSDTDKGDGSQAGTSAANTVSNLNAVLNRITKLGEIDEVDYQNSLAVGQVLTYVSTAQGNRWSNEAPTGGTDTHIGDTDLTLSGARTLEMSSNNLSFENGGSQVARIYANGYIQGTGRFILDGNGNVGGSLRIGDADNSARVTLQSPTTLSSNVVLTLPDSDGTDGQVLKTDGSGNLSFTDQSGGGSTLTQVYNVSFIDDIATSLHYLPFKDVNEQTTIYQEEAAMLMPFDGKIRSVSVKCSSITGAGNLTVKVHTCPTGINIFAPTSWTTEETEVMAFTATDDHHTFHFVFDNAQHFEAGDMVSLSIQSSVDPGGFAYWHSTTIVDFDTSTDLGTSSTEHAANP